MTFDPEFLRQAMRSWTTGVTVVTSLFGSTRHGMTVSSFTSLSLHPPQVLVALAQNTRTHDLVTRSGMFGVSILSASQQEIADRFAGRVSDEDNRFEGLETFSLRTGVPLLAGSLAALDCQVVTTLGSGTHTVFVGEVLSVRHFSYEHPLLYFNRQYHELRK